MTRRLLIVCVAFAAFLVRTGVAHAQLGPIAGGVVRTPAPPVSPANGLQLAEGAILHAGVGVEGGYDSNVFYNDADPTAAPVLRVTPFLELTNTARSGEIPSSLFFDLRAALTYREYLSSQSDITRLRAFVPTISGALEHNSQGTLASALTETYTRMEDAPYVRSTQGLIIRDNNVASAQLRWAPGGGASRDWCVTRIPSTSSRPPI